jgi:hypothetical protein
VRWPPPAQAFCVFCLVTPISDTDDLVVVEGGFLCPFCADALKLRPCAYCSTIHGVAEQMTWSVAWGHA